MAKDNGFVFGLSMIECVIIFFVVKAILGFLNENKPQIEDENKPKVAQVEVVEKKPEEDLFKPIIEPVSVQESSSEHTKSTKPSWKDSDWQN